LALMGFVCLAPGGRASALLYVGFLLTSFVAALPADTPNAGIVLSPVFGLRLLSALPADAGVMLAAKLILDDGAALLPNLAVEVAPILLGSS
jgi:hypothetical protein